MSRPTIHRDLPQECPPRTRSRSLALALVAVLIALLLSNEVARVALRARTRNIGYALISQKWRLLEQRERPLDWLVLGDSSCNQGVEPAVLAESLGGEALNLCTVANGLVLDGAWMLETYLDRFGPPRSVALVHSFHVWHRDLEPSSLAHVPLPWGFWKRLEPNIRLDASQRLQTWLARHVPLYAENRSLATLLKHPGHTYFRYEVDARGFMRRPTASPQNVERDAGRRLAWLEAQSELRVSPFNQAALLRIGELADRHGFDVYLLNAPIFRGVAESQAFRRYFSQLEGALQGTANQFARVHYVPREFVFEIDEMDTADHVIEGAAVRYTRAVASEIRRVQGG